MLAAPLKWLRAIDVISFDGADPSAAIRRGNNPRFGCVPKIIGSLAILPFNRLFEHYQIQ
jgi:hypothetical protein